MSLFFPKGYTNSSDSLNGGGIGAALVIHAGIVVIVALGLGQSEKLSEIARPLTVRMIEAVHPEEMRPVVPRNVQPKAQPKVIKTPVMVSNAPSVSHFVVEEQPVAPSSSVIQIPPPSRGQNTEPLIEARFDADYLSNPKPPYPSASRRLGEAGTVYLRVHVSADGLAHKVEIKSSSGFSRLDQSALDTVAAWRFVPAKRGSSTVASWVVVPIVFSLT